MLVICAVICWLTSVSASGNEKLVAMMTATVKPVANARFNFLVIKAQISTTKGGTRDSQLNSIMILYMRIFNNN